MNDTEMAQKLDSILRGTKELLKLSDGRMDTLSARIDNCETRLRLLEDKPKITSAETQELSNLRKINDYLTKIPEETTNDKPDAVSALVEVCEATMEFLKPLSDTPAGWTLFKMCETNLKKFGGSQ